MTPQLQQAIKLLALSNLEIEGFIAEELEKNPLLDQGAGDGERDVDLPDIAGEPGDDFEAGESVTADRLMMAGNAEGDAPLDVDYGEETFHHDSPSDSVTDMPGQGLDGGLGFDGTSHSGGSEEAGVDFDSIAAGQLSLHEHLLEQAGATLSGERLMIARHLIDQIDEAGYLTVAMLDMALRLDVPQAEVEAALAAIQSFDPTGVGARSLAECLALQAREADRYDPAMARLIDNLDLLAKGAMPQLKRMCDVDSEDLADMIQELRGL